MSVGANHRLRMALAASSHTPAELASAAGVDPKSVERWVTQGRLPHPATRRRVAALLGADESYLWPELLTRDPALGSTQAELVQLWPSRDAVPSEVWRSLIDAAHEIDVLVYSGGFIVESMRLIDRIAEVSAAGGTVRMLVGDSTSAAVAERGRAEGLPSLPARAASTLEYLHSVRQLPGVSIRIHDTPLYVSLYRFDDQLLANPHTHGLPAKDSPVFHLHHVPGGRLMSYYTNAFERVWHHGRPPLE